MDARRLGLDMREPVSVILPYFNRSDTLLTAAHSVLKQTYQNIILYMINDGSTDDSADIARNLQDKRIRHLDLDRNSGAAVARNRALSSVDSDLVAFMDSDDIWEPEKLYEQVHLLRDAQASGFEVSVVGCGWRYQGSDAPPRTFARGPFSYADVLRGRASGIGTPMLLVDRAAAHPDAYFDGQLPALEDRDYVMACLSNGSLLLVSQEILAVVTRHRHDHMANAYNAALAYEYLMAKYRADLHNEPDLLSWYSFRASREHIRTGRRRSAVRHLSSALRVQPTRRFFHFSLGFLAKSKGLAVAQKVFPTK